MIKKCHKRNNLVAAAGILELAGVEARAAAEEVVDFAGFNVVGEAGDEESVDRSVFEAIILVELVEVVIVHFPRSQESRG